MHVVFQVERFCQEVFT